MAEVVNKEVPQAFVKWTKMPIILEQCLGDSVTCIMYICFRILVSIDIIRLTQLNGALLSVAGSRQDIHIVIGGIVSSIWGALSEEADAAILASPQQLLLIECCGGKLSVCRVGHFLLTLFSESPECPGLLLERTSRLSNALAEPLSMVYT